MTDTQTSSGPIEAGISQLSESLTQAAESHRVLVQDMAEFSKDESLRFANLRLARNGALLDKLQTCAGLPGLIGVQQEWLRDFVQDYTGQNLRFAGAFRGLTRNVVASAVEAGSDIAERVQQETSETVHQAAEAGAETMDHVQHQPSDMVHQNGEQMAQDANTYVQEPLH